ncbi:MAG TPA: asparagine synthase (glutamine-hydrolyzing) [Prosthecobacter sp.]
MCGFLGWFHSPGASWREEELAVQRRELAQLSHRGPDDAAAASGDGWWMGFRRLSILDLSTHARQPMSFCAGRRTLTFNGEIYNFRELRAMLGQASLDSSGDTAVLGTLLTREPVPEVLAKLRGMFAFAWRDEDAGTLTLVRDHFGIKPLYYHELPDGGLVYGSELRAVARLAGVASEVSAAAVAQFFQWGAVQGPDTVFPQVRCLPPGHLLVWKEGLVEVRRWFALEWPGPDAWVADEAEQRRLVREGVLASVQAHLVADVPVGVFLSGGLDSTLVTACMREAGARQIQAFSIGYEENAGVPDESATARRTADYYGCEFVGERLTADTLEARLDDYFDDMDQPTGDALNTWAVSQVAARHVKVVLSGLGADEWWAGYNFHRLVLLAARAGGLRSTGGLMRALAALLPAHLRGRQEWKMLFYAFGGAGSDVAAWHAHARTIMPAGEVARLLRGDAAASGAVTPPFAGKSPGSWLHELLLRETSTYLANTLLRDNDATSMAHSLELRVPLVDVEMFRLAGRMPPEAKVSLGGGKRVLRAAFHDLLPPWIAQDRKKKGFTLPLMKWMRLPRWQQRIRDTLSSRVCRDREWLQPQVVSRLCEDYFGGRSSSTAVWAQSQRVWLLYVLEEWARRHLDAGTRMV